MHETIETMAVRLSQRLGEPLPGPDAQRRFAPRPVIDGWAPEQTPRGARPAAVLLLLYPGAAGPAFPLTRRHATLPTHGGQISLPGGAIDPGESHGAAALREAQEEIGVLPDTVRILGTLSTLWIPVSNYLLTPVVGLVDTAPAFRLHTAEVDALIEVPVTTLLDHTAIRWARRHRGSTTIDYPYYDVSGEAVWGATAMVLSEFAALFGDGASPGAPPG